MRNKHLLSFSVIFILFLFPSNSLATSWAYPFVVWEGYIYEVVGEFVTKIDNEIGQVTRYSDMESYAGNFSNAFKEGTKYYSIHGISTGEAIAVQLKDGQYKKAIRRGQYAEGKYNFSSILVKVVIFLILILIFSLVIYLFKKRLRS